MKMRQGFVSNSSSSSFVVDIYVDWWAKRRKKAITREQEMWLKKYGFKRTNQHSMMILVGARCIEQNDEVASADETVTENDEGLYYGYFVACNQDDVIEFLVKHRIPFKAMLHYGHDTAIYDGKSDKVDMFHNFGVLAEMYGVKILEDDYQPKPHERVKYPQRIHSLKNE